MLHMELNTPITKQMELKTWNWDLSKSQFDRMFNLVLFVGQDMLQDALLCFGATSTSVDEDDDNEDSDEVG